MPDFADDPVLADPKPAKATEFAFWKRPCSGLSASSLMRRRPWSRSGLERRLSSLAAEPPILIEKVEVMADQVPVEDGIVGIAQARHSDGEVVKTLREPVDRRVDGFEGGAVESGGGLAG